MVFNSIIFIFTFLPIVIFLYYISPRRIRNLILFLASLVFYAWGEPIYLFLILFSVLFNYMMGIEIARTVGKRGIGKRKAKSSLLFAVFVNVFILGFFKYYGFLVENVNQIFSLQIPHKELALPIGISFFTFQILSYLLDVYWKRVRVQDNLLSFGLYVTMFTQVTSGPIVRYIDIEEQLTERDLSLAELGNGARRFMVGLGKKLILANNIGAVWTAISSISVDELSVLSAWVGIVAYTLQIYFDFSGYSDMAIGLGEMFGFKLPENFKYPYMSASITEFWRRWHISLGTWFREYIYIPLGGNREGVIKSIRNILIVWALTGFWHGASWNFIVWGLYYGLLLLIEKFVLGKVIERIPAVVKHFYTMLFVIIGWNFFAHDSLLEAIRYLKIMFFMGEVPLSDDIGIYYLLTNLILFLMLLIGATPLLHQAASKWVIEKGRIARVILALGYVLIFLISIAYMVTETYSPFLYFRF